MKTFFTISMLLALFISMANVSTSEANTSETTCNSAITLNAPESDNDPNELDEFVVSRTAEHSGENLRQIGQIERNLQKYSMGVQGLPPTGVGATDNGNGTVDVNWNAPGDLTGFLYYNVYRSEQSGFVPTPANRIAENITDTAYLDGSVADFRTYYYVVSANYDNGSPEEIFSDQSSGVLVNITSQTTALGYAFLEARFNHANIKVKFEPVSPSAVADSVYTNALGYFEINDLFPGVYSVRMSRPGFQTPLIFENLTIVDDIDLGETTLYDLGTTVSGNVSGNWSGFVSVAGNISVPAGDSLIIDAGTVIRFLGNYDFSIYGYLASNGAEGDTVVFTSAPANQVQQPNQWQRIRFYNSADDNSYFHHTKIEFANDGIYCEWSGPQIENCLISRIGRFGLYFANSYTANISGTEIRYCGDDGMNLQASYVNMENSIVSNYTNEGAYLTSYSRLTVTGSSFSYGRTGIYLNDVSDVITDDCVISNNSEQGIFFNYSYSRGNVTNSTFSSNARGIYLYYASHPRITGNLFTQNTTGIEYYYDCDASVEDNEFNENQYGIVFNTSSHYCQTTITGNLIINNTVDGIHKNSYNWGPAETNPRIINNTISNNGRHGLYMDRPGTETIQNNIISFNGQWGMLNNAMIETFENNNVFGNTSGAISNLANVPSATWNFISFNPNNDATCDIYRNISEDPLFSGTGAQVFSLTAGSKSVNGGAEEITDPDGSVSDMGAFYFDLGNPHIIAATGYANQQVSLEWAAVANDSVVEYNVYYKESESETGYTLFGNTTETMIDVTGLTNNVLYDFTVTGVYAGYESQYAPKVSERPGTAIMDYDPGSFSLLIPSGEDQIVEDFAITNSGSRNLSVNFAEGNPNPGFAAFDGSGDFIHYGHHDHLHGMTTFTLECWVYRQSNNYMEFMGKNYRNYQLGFSGSQVYFYKGYGTSGSNSYQSWATGANIPLNQWSHLALTWEGSRINIYVNGNLAWSTNDANTGAIPDFYHYGFELGRRAGENSHYFIGKLAEARMWNVARTEEEITNSMLVSLRGNEDGLIGYWPLQNDIDDHSGFGITGAINGDVTLQTETDLPYILFSLPQQNYIIAPGQTETIPVTFFNRTDISSKYFTTLFFSDDPARRESELEIFLQYGETVPASPVYFSPVSSTDKPYTIVIKDATIDGQTIAVGDEIAAFDGELCVGAGIYNGQFNFVFTAWEKDDSNALPGYTPGNPITFRLYDTSADLETNEAEETWIIGDDTFGYGNFSVVALEASVYNIQSVAITGGQYNLVSFNLFPRFPNAWSVFGGLSDLQIVYNDEGQVLIPEYNINTIGDVNFLDGFYLYSNQAETIDYEGTFIRPEDWDITVEPGKWNYISVLSRNPVAVTDVFAGFESDISIIQSASGLSWIPSQGINTIGNMLPGQGYKIALSSATPITFSYPAGSFKSSVPMAAEKEKPGIPAETTAFVANATGLPYAVVVHFKNLQESVYSLQPGDEIGLFDGNLCVAAAVYDGTDKFLMTAWQKDEAQNLDGFTIGNAMIAKIFRSETGLITRHPIKNFNGTIPAYGAGNFAHVIIETIPVGEEMPRLSANPNPFKNMTSVVMEIPEEDVVNLNIFDQTGRLVKTLASGMMKPDIHYFRWDGTDHTGLRLHPGVYFIIAETTQSVFTEKVVIMQ